MTSPSDTVFSIQLDLARLGLFKGPIDGVWGKTTHAAARMAKTPTLNSHDVARTLAERIAKEAEDIRHPTLAEVRELAPDFRRVWLRALHSALDFGHILPARLPAFMASLCADTEGLGWLPSTLMSPGHELFIGVDITTFPERGKVPRLALRTATVAWLDAGHNARVDLGHYPAFIRMKEGEQDRTRLLSWLQAAEKVFGVVADVPPSTPLGFRAPAAAEPERSPQPAHSAPPTPPPATRTSMKRLVYIDVQHSGKPPKRMADRGATADLNHNGMIEVEDMEARWTPIIAYHLEGLLLSDGYQVIPISDGWYSARHGRVNEYADQAEALGYHNQVYIALHLNSLIGGKPSDSSGKYSSFFFDRASSVDGGGLLAEKIASAMVKQLKLAGAPEDARAIAAHSSGWTANAYSTIRGLGQQVIGICAEPYFMDQILHPIHEEGMKQAAVAMKEGLDEWFTHKFLKEQQ